MYMLIILLAGGNDSVVINGQSLGRGVRIKGERGVLSDLTKSGTKNVYNKI